MVSGKSLSLLLLTCCWLGAQNLPEDPVMKARTQRAQAQGISEADLPAVPRSIMAPPPLPPPEIHLKDARGARAPKSQVKLKPTMASAKSRRASSRHQQGIARAKPTARVRKKAAPEGKAVAVRGKHAAAPARSGKKPGKRAPKAARKGKA